MATPPFFSLPPELQDMVIDNLEDKHDIINAGFLDRTWRERVTQRRWRHLGPEGVAHLLYDIDPWDQQAFADRVRHLFLYSVLTNPMTGAVIPEMPTWHLRFNNLETLTFEHRENLGPGTNITITPYLQPNLRMLKVEGGMQPPAMVANPDDWLAKLHQRCPMLESLTIARLIQGATAAKLKQALRNLPHLKRLYVVGAAIDTGLIDGETMVLLAEMQSLRTFGTNRSLEVAEVEAMLSDGKEPFAELERLWIPLPAQAAMLLLPRLKSVTDLWIILMTDGRVLRHIRFMSKLEKLSVELPHPTRLHFDDLNGLRALNLTSLSLTCGRSPLDAIQMSDLTDAQVATFLSGMPNLENLELAWQDVRFPSHLMLGLVANHCKKLLTLTLRQGWQPFDLNPGPDHVSRTFYKYEQVMFPKLRALTISELERPQGFVPYEFTAYPMFVETDLMCPGSTAVGQLLRWHCPKLLNLYSNDFLGRPIEWFDNSVMALIGASRPGL